MENKVKKVLKEDLVNNVNNFSNISLTDDGKRKGLAVIAAQAKFLNDDGNQTLEIKLKKEKQELEKRRIEQQSEIEQARLNFEKDKLEYQKGLDKDRLEIEKAKTDIEYIRLNNEKDSRKSEDLKWKIGLGITIGTQVLLTVIPLLVYRNLAIKDMNLTYFDDGRTPSNFKENVKNILKIRSK